MNKAKVVKSKHKFGVVGWVAIVVVLVAGGYIAASLLTKEPVLTYQLKVTPPTLEQIKQGAGTIAGQVQEQGIEARKLAENFHHTDWLSQLDKIFSMIATLVGILVGINSIREYRRKVKEERKEPKE